MSGSIGPAPQIQPNVIQNSVQQNAQKAVQRDSDNTNGQVAQANANQDFVKLAQDIIAERASGVEVGSSSSDRGQVVDLLV